VTKEEYLSFGNEQFLSEDEKDRERQQNELNHYGLSDSQLLDLTRKHKTARKAENYRTMARIEYRLTDINFHWECGKMYCGSYDEILEKLKKGAEKRWMRQGTDAQ
jgi:hypothetical protein